MAAATPVETIAAFVPSLPQSWRGGVSVFGGPKCDEDKMPLLHRYIWDVSIIRECARLLDLNISSDLTAAELRLKLMSSRD